MADASPSEPMTPDSTQPDEAKVGEEMPNEANESEAPVVSGSRRRRLFVILLIVVVVAAIGWAAWYFLTQAGREQTDNAYVGADVAQVTALVPGPVLEVHVEGTQAVKKGAVLVVLDPAEAHVEVETARADLLQAKQKFGQTSAQVNAARSRVTSRAADIAQERARRADAVANLERTRIELGRRQALISSGAVSGEEVTSAQAAYSSAKAAVTLADAGIASAEAARASSTSDLNASAALIQGVTAKTNPEVAAAQARLDAAELNLARTVLRAPIDGIVTNRQVQIGQRIAAGAPIMTLVPIAAAYVDANFKESQLRDVRPGQPVELTSDYYGSGVKFHGRVRGFAGGTGAAFSLVPAQNATGNWVKVVQRLPVRIALDPRELRRHPLRVGLSMNAIVDTRGH